MKRTGANPYFVSEFTTTSDLIEKLRVWAERRGEIRQQKQGRTGPLDSTLLLVTADRLEELHNYRQETLE